MTFAYERGLADTNLQELKDQQQKDRCTWKAMR